MFITPGSRYQGNLLKRAAVRGIFYKSDTTIVAWTKTAAFKVSTAVALLIDVNGTLKTISAGTVITMPASPAAGTDYAIWAKTDGTLEATSDFVTPPTSNARQVGGFHYAPGGNATGTTGGDTTPAINAYSLWDLKWRPACADPRGMTLVAGRFWADIYLCGVDHYANGTSRYNVTIADGSSPPKVPALFGGNGSTAYSTFTWFEASLVMQSAGKALLTYGEYVAACYGTTEASSGGTDPVSTILRAAYTSKWGLMLATGNLWQWADESASAIAAFLGGYWGNGAGSGSRASNWGDAPSASDSGIGARGRCDHLHHV
jgi:hypothetical protein